MSSGKYKALSEDSTDRHPAQPNDCSTSNSDENENENEIEELQRGNTNITVVHSTHEDKTEIEVPVELHTEHSKDMNEITVKIKGMDDKNYDVQISRNSTVGGLKALLSTVTGLPAERQRLIFAGKLLNDGNRLEEINIKDGNFVHLAPKALIDSGNQLKNEAEHRPNDPNDPSEFQDINLPRIQAILAARNGGDNENEVAFEVVGFDDHANLFGEDVEITFWRSRLRLFCILMLFYYSLALCTSVFTFLFQSYKNQSGARTPGQFYIVKHRFSLSIFDICENVLGFFVSVHGIKTAMASCPIIAGKFVGEVSLLCVIHFLSLFLWIFGLIEGDIVMVPPHPHRAENHGDQHLKMNEEYSISTIVGQLLVVHPFIWVIIMYVVIQFRRKIAAMHITQNPPISDNNTAESES